MPGLSDPRPFHWGAVASLLALILLTLAWELWLAPLRPGGSWLVLKAAILLLPLRKRCIPTSGPACLSWRFSVRA